MTNHMIWAAGLVGHLLVLGVLFARRRVSRFPWFTLLITFYLLRSIGLAATVRFSGLPAYRLAMLVIDITDVFLQSAVWLELTWMALRSLSGLRRFTLLLLLLTSGILMVLRLAPTTHASLRMVLLLGHFLLSLLMVEWALVLLFLLRPLRLTWRSPVAALSFGFGVYSFALLGGGGYFTVGREMSAFVFFAFLRVFVYLLVLVWWAVCLWIDAPVPLGVGGRPAE